MLQLWLRVCHEMKILCYYFFVNSLLYSQDKVDQFHIFSPSYKKVDILNLTCQYFFKLFLIDKWSLLQWSAHLIVNTCFVAFLWLNLKDQLLYINFSKIPAWFLNLNFFCLHKVILYDYWDRWRLKLKNISIECFQCPVLQSSYFYLSFQKNH